MIKVQNLYYDYPEIRALNTINFELSAGSITALIGPNGAGKTTLLRSIAGLDEPINGNILIGDLNVWESPNKARHVISYLPDHFGLYEQLNLIQNLTYAGWAHGLRGEQLDQSISWILDKLRLTMSPATLAKQLSRGQKQRLALAQVLIHRPKIVLLDEPASGLDPQSRETLSQLIVELANEGMTFIISSHILNELEDYCSGILVLEKGKILSHQDYQPQHTTSSDKSSKTLEIALLNPNDHSALLAYLQSESIAAQQTKHIIECTIYGDNTDVYQLLNRLIQNWQIIHFAIQTDTLQKTYFNILDQHQKQSHNRKEQ